MIPDPNGDDCPNFITAEWVGKKHQSNMDNILVDHAIVLHGTTKIEIPRTFKEIEELAKVFSIEGVVLTSNRTGERFKIRFDMFQDSLWRKN